MQQDRSPLALFPLGSRVRLRRLVERGRGESTGEVVQAGATGTVTTNDATTLGVTLDQHVAWLSEWSNELLWVDDFETAELLADLERIEHADGLALVCIPGRTDDEAGTWFVCVESSCRSIADAGNSHTEARVRLALFRAERARRESTNAAHANAGGDLCADQDADGCCDACGVSLGDPCEVCGGNGYHRAGCSESEE